MAQIPGGAQQSEFFKLISGALLGSDRKYGSITEFFRDEFQNYFPNAEWKKLYEVDMENRTGKYTQVIGKTEVPVMAAYMAFDADGQLIGNSGFELNTESMPVMKLAYNFNEQSLEEGEYLASLGLLNIPTSNIFNNFLKDSTSLIAGINRQRSYTGLQIESTGAYLSTKKNNAGGAQGLKFDFRVPADNKKKAGGYGKRGKKKAWSDDAASPIGDLLDMVKYAKDHFIPYGVIRMNENTYLQMIEHPNTKQQVAAWRTQGMILKENMTDYIITDDVMAAYLQSLRLPPIEVVKWTASQHYIDPDTQTLKQIPLVAFADNTVLLRPAGTVGRLQWKSITSGFSTPSNPMYYAENRMIAIQQTINSKQRAMQFCAESKCIPVPDNIDYFLYLKTDEAAA